MPYRSSLVSNELPLVKNISRFLLFVFAGIMLLEIIPEGFASRQLERQKDFGVLLETTGNLQGLSQRLSFIALAQQSVTDPELRSSIQSRFESNLENFENGSTNLLRALNESTLVSDSLKHDLLERGESLEHKLSSFAQSARGVFQSSEKGKKDIGYLMMLGDGSSSVYSALDTLASRLRQELSQAVDSYVELQHLLALLNLVLIGATGAYVVFRLTGRIRTELELRLKAEDTLQVRLRDLEQFSAAVAHDLRGPLHNIHLAGALLREKIGSMNSEADDLLQMVSHQAEQLSHMIQELLGFFRAESNELRTEEVSLCDLVDSTTQTLSLPLKERNAVVHCQDDLRMKVDPSLFGNVLQNLIQNSIQHADVETPEVTISANRVRTPRKKIVLRVRDNGIGIPADVRDKIFHPFTRSSKSKSEDGIGLGLALVQRIVQRHNGTITLESPPNGGACFRIILPD